MTGFTPPRRLLADVYVGDDEEIERAVRAATRDILRAPSLAADRLPPGKRAWFEGFIHRSVEGALLQSHPDAAPADLDGLWATFAHDLAHNGVVSTVVQTTQLANDGDGTDGRLGWTRNAHATLCGFLRDVPDQRALFKSVIEARDPEEWRRYPDWFGPPPPDATDPTSLRRALAARWLHPSGDTRDYLHVLLDDGDPLVRHIAAVRLGELAGARVDDRVRERLQEAARDPDWIWSYRDHFEEGQTGAKVAAMRLAALDEGRR